MSVLIDVTHAQLTVVTCNSSDLDCTHVTVNVTRVTFPRTFVSSAVWWCGCGFSHREEDTNLCLYVCENCELVVCIVKSSTALGHAAVPAGRNKFQD